MAVNWWFEMKFGRDWVYRELCFNLRNALADTQPECDCEQKQA